MSLPGEHHDAGRVVRLGHAEGVAVPVQHQNARPGGAQFAVPGLVRPPGRAQRERQGNHAVRVQPPCRAADDARSVAPAALDEREPRLVQRRDDL